MSGRRWLRLGVPAVLVAGLALMIPFEATITRVLGVACLFAFMIGGVFLVADERFLSRDE